MWVTYMSKPKAYQPTPEQLARWKRIEELEPTEARRYFLRRRTNQKY